MEKSIIYKTSISKLKEFVFKTSPEEIDMLIKSCKDLKIDGPKFNDYLNGIQEHFEDLNYSFDSDLLVDSVIDTSCIFDYPQNYADKYYMPPPNLGKDKFDKKDSSLFEESFFLV
jgi:hypothetical protein